MAKEVLKNAQEVYDAFVDPTKTPEIKTAPGVEEPIDKFKFGYGWPEVSADGWNYRLFDATTCPPVTVETASAAAPAQAGGAGD